MAVAAAIFAVMAVAVAIFAVVGTTATVVAYTADKLAPAIVVSSTTAAIAIVGNSHCSASLSPFPTPAATVGITATVNLSAVGFSAASTVGFTPPMTGNPTDARTAHMRVDLFRWRHSHR